MPLSPNRSLSWVMLGPQWIWRWVWWIESRGIFLACHVMVLCTSRKVHDLLEEVSAKACKAPNLGPKHGPAFPGSSLSCHHINQFKLQRPSVIREAGKTGHLPHWIVKGLGRLVQVRCLELCLTYRKNYMFCLVSLLLVSTSYKFWFLSSEIPNYVVPAYMIVCTTSPNIWNSQQLLVRTDLY